MTTRVALAGLLVLLVATTFAGYQQLFSTFAEYDDEGYLMQSLASAHDGRPLYDETYTQYGPAYYLAHAAFFRVTGLPLTHDVTRLKTLVCWIALAALAAANVRALGGSWWACVLGFPVGFLHLDRLCLEPGHPQELCALVLLATPLIARATDAGGPWRRFALGTVGGIALMTKSNVGVFLIAAVTVALVLLAPRDRARLLRVVLVAAIPVLPFVVTIAHLAAPGGMLLPVLVAVSSLGVLVTALASSDIPTGPRFVLPPFFCGIAVTVAASLGYAAWTGTTPTGVLDVLVRQQSAFVRAFSCPPPIPAIAIPWAVALVGVAMMRRATRAGLLVAVVVAGGTLAWSALCYAGETDVPLVHGLIDRGGAGVLIAFVTPTLWALLAPASAERRARRLVFCLVACLQPLAIYPTPGTQTAIASIPLAVGAIVVLDDAVRASSARRPRLVAIPVLLVVALSVVVGARDVVFFRRRAAFIPLGLPGATRLRLPADTVADYRWLATTLRERSDTFVFAEHGRDSFYFWTDRRPPTAINPTFWPFMLTDAQQERVVAALRETPRVAVVHEKIDQQFPPDLPLRAYLDAEFTPALHQGRFDVWLRRPPAHPTS